MGAAGPPCRCDYRHCGVVTCFIGSLPRCAAGANMEEDPMLARNRAKLLTGTLGIAALVVAAGTAPGHAASAGERLNVMPKIGLNCARATKSLAGTLCLIRASINNTEQLHYRLTFDGAVTHFIVKRAQSQTEIAADESGRSRILSERAKTGDVVQVKVQACKKRQAGAASCSNWMVLKIIK